MTDGDAPYLQRYRERQARRGGGELDGRAVPFSARRPRAGLDGRAPVAVRDQRTTSPEIVAAPLNVAGANGTGRIQRATEGKDRPKRATDYPFRFTSG